MHVYIDESGQFRPLDGTRSLAAAVVALVIPSSTRTACAKDLRSVKRRLAVDGAEPKGSSLSEAQIREFLTVLRRHDAIAEAVVLDAGAHGSDEVTRFKNAQAERLLGNITREHQDSLIEELLDLGSRLRRLPNQLFLQAFALWQLIPRLIETATMFYSQRRPRELGRFVWRIDAKDRSITELEDLWTQLIGPIITTKTTLTPMGMIPGGDYTYYEQFDASPEHTSENPPGRFSTDMRQVLRNDFRFVPSQADLGVQAADILAAALTRALNGKLGQHGWELIAPLFVKRRGSTIHLIALEPDAAGPDSQPVRNDHWARVISQLETRARPMLTARTAALLREGGA